MSQAYTHAIINFAKCFLLLLHPLSAVASSFNWTGVFSDSQGGELQFAMALNLSSKTSTIVLNDGNKMPVFGLGVYLAQANGETEQAVLWALKHGYRLIDTAAIYRLV